MVFVCSAYNCKNTTKENGITFHSFPHKNPKLLKKWLVNMRWKDWTPALHSKLCSGHFEDKCFSRFGRVKRLYKWAVPTIFSFPEHMQRRKALINPRSRRYLQTVDESKPVPAAMVRPAPAKVIPLSLFRVEASINQESGKFVLEQRPVEPLLQCRPVQTSSPAESTSEQRPLESGLEHGPGETTEKQTPGQPGPKASDSGVAVKRPLKSPPWTILGDEAIYRNLTVPSFFHSGYCLPQCIRWAGEDELNVKPHVVKLVPGQTVPHVIEIRGRWEWLGLDVRGPLPQTVRGHRYIMTLTDYHSKWVEAFPLTPAIGEEVAQNLSEVIVQLGYPLCVLSRLCKRLIVKINRVLKHRLHIAGSSLVIQHHQTGYLDLATESLLNRMVSDLVKDYPHSWHLHVPAAALRLCCTDHPTTHEKPFSCMYTSSPQPSMSQRELPFSASDIRLSSFVVQSATDDVQDKDTETDYAKTGQSETNRGNDATNSNPVT
ncbi:uncharacterized protein LOC115819458 [Chanos chanos]|uniref:THAP domain-containing protein 1 n=1 Tax=Chanos chanos TaxID=29144 RepID=A0A6J2W618_CHACN|nr:uncharacterized protein LOC115819458 [Chanos chanos]